MLWVFPDDAKFSAILTLRILRIGVVFSLRSLCLGAVIGLGCCFGTISFSCLGFGTICPFFSCLQCERYVRCQCDH